MRTLSVLLLGVLCGCDGPYDGPGVGKYQLGMTIAQAQALMSQPFPVIPSGLQVVQDSKSEKERGEFYWIHVDDEEVDLTFNWYKRLIKAERVPARK